MQMTRSVRSCSCVGLARGNKVYEYKECVCVCSTVVARRHVLKATSACPPATALLTENFDSHILEASIGSFSMCRSHAHMLEQHWPPAKIFWINSVQSVTEELKSLSFSLQSVKSRTFLLQSNDFGKGYWDFSFYTGTH
ncbi:hypothetical protein BaRGS_00024064 [Batillaria attramentaria]|uniref:Uncharacterized protein n=1 Tax=Batillaria attramentaria TaxID=370345 RepID=A0ABD0KCF5_9CAEN